MSTIHLEPSQVPAHLRTLFGYGGKTFEARVATEVHVPMTAGLWDGGSRDSYHAVRLDTGAEASILDERAAPWDRSRRDVTLRLAPGLAVVVHTIFCGKDLGLAFYVHPDNAAKLLPAPGPNLTREQRIVLGLVCSYIPRARREYAAREKIDAAAYDRTIGELKALGLLSKSGGVTPAGRNARAALGQEGRS